MAESYSPFDGLEIIAPSEAGALADGVRTMLARLSSSGVVEKYASAARTNMYQFRPSFDQSVTDWLNKEQAGADRSTLLDRSQTPPPELDALRVALEAKVRDLAEFFVCTWVQVRSLARAAPPVRKRVP